MLRDYTLHLWLETSSGPLMPLGNHSILSQTIHSLISPTFPPTPRACLQQIFFFPILMREMRQSEENFHSTAPTDLTFLPFTIDYLCFQISHLFVDKTHSPLGTAFQKLSPFFPFSFHQIIPINVQTCWNVFHLQNTSLGTTNITDYCPMSLTPFVAKPLKNRHLHWLSQFLFFHSFKSILINISPKPSTILFLSRSKRPSYCSN